MTPTAYHQDARNVCRLCGSDDLQKADDLMLAVNAEMVEAKRIGEAPMTPERFERVREASALRAPHFNRGCVAK